MLGPQKLPKNDQKPKKKFQTRFSIAKRRKIMNWDPLQEEGPKQARQKAGFRRFLVIFWPFLKGCCITWNSWQCTQKMQKKHSILDGVVVFCPLGKKTEKMLLDIHFPVRTIQKQRRQKSSPKPGFSTFLKNRAGEAPGAPKIEPTFVQNGSRRPPGGHPKPILTEDRF